MAVVDSVKLPDNSSHDIADNYSGYQKQTLTAPLTINDTQETTVEGALGGLNDYGDALADNLAANEENGAKNLLRYPYYRTSDSLNGLTFTDNGDGTVSVSGTASANTDFAISLRTQADGIEIKNGSYILNGCPSGGGASTYRLLAIRTHNGAVDCLGTDTGNGANITLNGDDFSNDTVHLGVLISIISGAVISIPITFKPMLRDARILDDTFVPYAKTNKELTDDKAERKDISTIHATGSTNTTGAQINAGTFFYLNGQFCKALTSIAANATFTENTNYKKTSMGGEIRCTVNDLTIDRTVMSGYGDSTPTNILGVNNEMLNGDIYELVATSTGLELNKYSNGVKTNIWTI